MNRADGAKGAVDIPLPAGLRSVVDFAEAALIDLPIAATKRMMAAGNNRELNEAGWKAYDAAISAANAVTDRTYTNSTAGWIAASALDFGVRLQRLNAALSGAIFATLWPALGLPPAGEIEAMRSEIAALRNQVQIATALSRMNPAIADARRMPARIGSEAMMMATSGVFQRPMFAGWMQPEAGEGEANGNVPN